MTTSSGHTRAILASRVKGTPVYNSEGEQIGHVEDIVLDKLSNEILFAVMAFGGFLGIGERYHPVPWSQLDYQEEMDGYVVPLSREQLQNAPSYNLGELSQNDGERWQRASAYYGGLGI